MMAPLIIRRENDPPPYANEVWQCTSYAIIPKYKWDDVDHYYPKRHELKFDAPDPNWIWDPKTHPAGYINHCFVDNPKSMRSSWVRQVNFSSQECSDIMDHMAIVPMELFLS